VIRREAQERLESTRGGRLVLSVGIAALLALIVVANLPASPLRRAAEPLASHTLAAIGVEQQWTMFAPDPRAVSIGLEARVLFRDGSTTTWRPPAGGALVGAYWDYHWSKLVEHATFDQGVDADAVRSGLARFAAREVAAPGREPAETRLVSIQSRDGERSELQVFHLTFGPEGP
jgi:hypothetical protein